jgi:hypothetical protein
MSCRTDIETDVRYNNLCRRSGCLADLKGPETVSCGNVRYLNGIIMLKLYGRVVVVSQMLSEEEMLVGESHGVDASSPQKFDLAAFWNGTVLYFRVQVRAEI